MTFVRRFVAGVGHAWRASSRGCDVPLRHFEPLLAVMLYCPLTLELVASNGLEIVRWEAPGGLPCGYQHSAPCVVRQRQLSNVKTGPRELAFRQLWRHEQRRIPGQAVGLRRQSSGLSAYRGRGTLLRIRLSPSTGEPSAGMLYSARQAQSLIISLATRVFFARAAQASIAMPASILTSGIL